MKRTERHTIDFADWVRLRIMIAQTVGIYEVAFNQMYTIFFFFWIYIDANTLLNNKLH